LGAGEVVHVDHDVAGHLAVAKDELSEVERVESAAVGERADEEVAALVDHGVVAESAGDGGGFAAAGVEGDGVVSVAAVEQDGLGGATAAAVKGVAAAGAKGVVSAH